MKVRQENHALGSEINKMEDNRRSLGFEKRVEKNFRFLSAYGFRCVRCESTFVRFESENASVNVYHGRRSHELGLELGPLPALSPEAPSYSMSAIVRLVDPDKAQEYRNRTARTVTGVAEGVEELASLFRRYVESGLLSAPRLFARLAEQRQAAASELARDVDLRHARNRLEEAWHEKDYATVVELLEPLREHLSPSELAKLEYAKKRAPRS